jgi:hypothetical protein
MVFVIQQDFVSVFQDGRGRIALSEPVQWDLKLLIIHFLWIEPTKMRFVADAETAFVQQGNAVAILDLVVPIVQKVDVLMTAVIKECV